MSNEELYNELSRKFNKREMMIFSMIEYRKNELLFDDDQRRRGLPSEREYDAQWWRKKYYELLNNK